MGQALGLCCTLGETKALREEVAFFQAVKVILTTRDVTAQKKTDAQCEQPNRYKFNSLKRFSYKGGFKSKCNKKLNALNQAADSIEPGARHRPQWACATPGSSWAAH